MKNYQLLFAVTGTFIALCLTGCNAGVNLSVPGAPVAEGNPITNGGQTATPTPIDPSTTPTPNPSATPTPAPGATPSPNAGKNRIFVSNALLSIAESPTEKYFNYICNREARRANVSGNFAVLAATSDRKFTDKHKVNGSIYQKFLGVETIVAQNIHDLFAGKNDSIFTTAAQFAINTTEENYVWTGQRNFEAPAAKQENCNNWSTKSGEAISGLVGAAGSDALAKAFQPCNTFAHIYCIETND